MTPDLPYWPAAMDLKSAAAYCGVCVDTFKRVCPVRPLKFTESTRGERYLRQRLDEWLASLDPNKQDAAPKRKFGERLYGGQSEAGRA
jgi:formate hydrogenlyase subunit 6/NADH:ubiquinone oxidoreductase subunit I